jgi:hypothetical protein
MTSPAVAAGTATGPMAPVLDFNNTAAAYSSMSDVDIMRAVAVFTACGCSPLVRHAEWLLACATRLLGQRAVAALVRPTFFRHFCAGEDADSIAPALARLREAGVGGILDYAAEADLPDSGGGSGEGGAGVNGEGDGKISFATHGVRTAPVYSARVYHYADGATLDPVLNLVALCARGGGRGGRVL